MAKNNELIAARDQGWLQGYPNLAAKENRRWWKTRTWLVQALIWIAIIDGLLLTVMLAAPEAGAPGESPTEVGLMIFTIMMGMAPAVGVVIIGQEAILSERQSGTAAWVLSKPASRSAFVLSKLVSDALGILVTAVLIPGVIGYLLLWLVGGQAFPILPFAAALGVIYISLLFYLTLTVMLGTIFNGRGGVIGIPLALLFGFQIFAGLLPFTMKIMPWMLAMSGGTELSLAAALASGQPLPSLLPLISTILWCIVFTAVAMWKFNREEF